MVILCDFDDTTADRNIATLLLDRFHTSGADGAGPHWRELHEQFLNNELSLVRYQEIAFSALETPREEQAAFVRTAAGLRPGFSELADYCASRGAVLAVVSHGLDFYIRALLEAEGLAGLPIFAVRTGSTNGSMTFAYEFSQPECEWWPGNCKCRVVQEYRAQGHSVVYAGDGNSDKCPAQHADYVFARDSLLRFCKERGLPHRELTDFHAMLSFLRSPEAEGLS